MEDELQEDIRRFLAEDLGERGDITSDALLTDQVGEGYVIAKQDCMVAGLAEATAVFAHLGLQVEQMAKDGEQVDAYQKVLRVTGSARDILAGERLALNIVARMSGIATLTHRLVETVHRKNPKVQVAATRKTTPGFRRYEKKAVELGGGMTHRWGLYDGIIIKDNHLRFMSIREAIRKAQQIGDLPVEVEVECMEDAVIAAEEKADIIMLDNMNPAKGKLAASEARSVYPEVKIEVSGGITPDNITNYTFANIISLGWLTHSVNSADFSLDLEKKG
ncbi:MAG: carboxylating nicotinate-nucleotide diphosphorylase [Candidatus Thermoplasmatota archaeon]|nr:carboxylating nicotinate-nucleotide diphosphorylase [Candidatus Thermoplasmatota archaeon]MDD5779202.1 carboxylating nicotinate-nucleotide diphosphorylase [Candidatus Thermoplasmatota archaeon]